MKLHLLRYCTTTLRNHVEFNLARNPNAAIQVKKKISLALSRLKDFPDSGRLGIRPGTRELVVTGLPYIIVYRVRPTGIEILRVFHTSMKLP